MPVSIRLSRLGRKGLPFYRVVVVDSRKKRDGEFLETIGTYDGLKTELVAFKQDRYDAWVKQGAQPSDTAKKLYRLFKRKGIAGATASKPSLSTTGVKEGTFKKGKKGAAKGSPTLEDARKSEQDSPKEEITLPEEPKE